MENLKEIEVCVEYFPSLVIQMVVLQCKTRHMSGCEFQASWSKIWCQDWKAAQKCLAGQLVTKRPWVLSLTPCIPKHDTFKACTKIVCKHESFDRIYRIVWEFLFALVFTKKNDIWVTFYRCNCPTAKTVKFDNVRNFLVFLPAVQHWFCMFGKIFPFGISQPVT